MVAAGLAGEGEVPLSYSIDLSQPVSVQVETPDRARGRLFGTGRIPDAEIVTLMENHFDFRLAGIIRQFNLRALPSAVKGGFYRKLAAYGHVGRMDIGLPWEVTDQAPVLRSAIPLSRTAP